MSRSSRPEVSLAGHFNRRGQVYGVFFTVQEGVTGSIPMTPTIQSPQTARFRYAQNRAFLRGSRATYFSDFGLCGRSPALAAVFGALSPHPKNPVPAAGFGTKSVRTCSRNSAFCAAVIQGSLVRRGNYSELSPSASNCRLHSVGGFTSRSMPMPRGRRPSTAALTRLGARKASEMAILTCRTLGLLANAKLCDRGHSA